MGSQESLHFLDRSEIRKIKQQDYTFNRREYNPEIWLVAAPVCDHNRLVIANLAVVTPSVSTGDMKSRNLISIIIDIAAEMSRDVGYKVPVNQNNSREPGSALLPIGKGACA